MKLFSKSKSETLNRGERRDFSESVENFNFGILLGDLGDTRRPLRLKSLVRCHRAAVTMRGQISVSKGEYLTAYSYS